MKYIIEVRSTDGTIKEVGTSDYKTRREALFAAYALFRGQGWVVALSEAAFSDGFDFELLTGIGQSKLTHTGWYIRIRDF